MITVTERNGGYTIADDDGQAVRHLSPAKAEELRAKLADALASVSTATTPAKARLMRYPAQPRK